ncbi:MAG: glycerol-3-phosphate acyltransferase [Dehalococcoidia bacterium]|nr:glycerol-3-phosphate acyltransferase [Dehalococcoidia bacterium]
MTYIAAFILGYVIGAAPIIYFVARARGIDLHSVGTGNIGAGNLWRHSGMVIGMLSVIIEVGKGTLAALLAANLLPGDDTQWLLVAGGVGAVVGQMWPVTLRFQGGRGNGTAAGALVAIDPFAFVFGFGIFLLFGARKIIRNVLPKVASAPPSRIIPVAVIGGMSVYTIAALALSENAAAIAGAVVLGLTFIRRATAPWPPDPETGEAPERSLFAILIYDRPNSGQ